MVVDHTLKMRKLPRQRQMDVLLSKNMVGAPDVKRLARRIADIHKNAQIIYDKKVMDVKEKFNDLNLEKEYLSGHLNKNSGRLIEEAIEVSNIFLNKNKSVLENRLKSGFFRDGHGDLHTRNIFLLPEPQPFDCIEFNDDYRQIDVLNEVAFLCMDLEALGKSDLAGVFITHYNQLFPTMRNEKEGQLFRYYKSYRANIRAKVNSLRAQSATDKGTKTRALTEAGKYLKLMVSYLDTLDMIKI
jgi:aminoglycoside phosphotransferase family enzyme